MHVVKFAAAEVNVNVLGYVRNSPELHEGARHTPRDLAERDISAGGAPVL